MMMGGKKIVPKPIVIEDDSTNASIAKEREELSEKSEHHHHNSSEVKDSKSDGLNISTTMDRVSLPMKKKKPRTIPALGAETAAATATSTSGKPPARLQLGDSDDEDRPMSIQRKPAPASITQPTIAKQVETPSAPIRNPLEDSLKE